MELIGKKSSQRTWFYATPTSHPKRLLLHVNLGWITRLLTRRQLSYAGVKLLKPLSTKQWVAAEDMRMLWLPADKQWLLTTPLRRYDMILYFRTSYGTFKEQFDRLSRDHFPQ